MFKDFEKQIQKFIFIENWFVKWFWWASVLNICFNSGNQDFPLQSNRTPGKNVFEALRMNTIRSYWENMSACLQIKNKQTQTIQFISETLRNQSRNLSSLQIVFSMMLVSFDAKH